MSKAGKRLLAAAQGMRGGIPTFTVSCGCVFCDLDLPPDWEVDGRPVHNVPHAGSIVFCTRAPRPSPSPVQERKT